jgi:hypothetical protein
MPHSIFVAAKSLILSNKIRSYEKQTNNMGKRAVRSSGRYPGGNLAAVVREERSLQ